MIKKVVRKEKLQDFSEIKENLAYWLSKSPEERVAEVERLRREHYGELPPIQKVARIVDLKTGKVIRDYPPSEDRKR